MSIPFLQVHLCLVLWRAPLTFRDLLVVVEDYPELKADQTFIRLLDNLEGTENGWRWNE